MANTDPERFVEPFIAAYLEEMRKQLKPRYHEIAMYMEHGDDKQFDDEERMQEILHNIVNAAEGGISLQFVRRSAHRVVSLAV